MQRLLLALCAALLLMVAAISPTFAQEPTTRGGSDSRSPGLELMRAMQSDPQVSRTMVFVVVGDDVPADKIAAEADQGPLETTVCNGKFCACRADNHASCDLFAWLCGKLGGQHVEGASVEGCFLP